MTTHVPNNAYVPKPLNARAARVAKILNGFAITLAVLGGIAALILFITGINEADSYSRYNNGLTSGYYLSLGIAAAIYAAFGWGVLKVSSLVAEYIAHRTA